MHVSKYNASGNDFVIFHTLKNADRSALARDLCDRFKGIGADGLIVLLQHDKFDFAWEFYNSDGSTAKMCGNGSRAAAFYAYKNGLCGANLSFLSGAGEIRATIEARDGLNLTPQSEFAAVEVALTKPKKLSEEFSENGLKWRFYDTGVPHLVTFEGEFDAEICKKMRAKYDANVNFAQIKDGAIFVRTFERGVEAETNACGTGMAACFYGALEALGDAAQVIPKSGERLNLRLKKGTIFFKGLVKHCFEANL